MGVENRPFKYGERDRREFIVQDSEVTLRAENDGNGDPTYLGRAKVGTLEAEEKWQIGFYQWDGNRSIISVTWPEDALGNPSSEYEFSWTDRAGYTYS